MFTKVEAFQDLGGNLHKTLKEAQQASWTWFIYNSQSVEEVEDTHEDGTPYSQVRSMWADPALALTMFHKHPQVLDWLVEQVKGKEFEIVQTLGTYDNPHPEEDLRCDDCGSTLFIHRNAEGNPTHASGCTCP